MLIPRGALGTAVAGALWAELLHAVAETDGTADWAFVTGIAVAVTTGISLSLSRGGAEGSALVNTVMSDENEPRQRGRS